MRCYDDSVVTFGEAVRATRQERGWTQRGLAVRAGVSQRTVSSCEKGVSEPEDQTKLAVHEVLPLPYEVVPSASGRHVHFGAPLLAELPFENLGPGDFEDFAVTLAGYLFPGAQAYRQGASGHTQHGFDVVVEGDGKAVAAIQCKRVKQFGRKDIDKAVAGATLNADSKFI